MTRVGEGAEAQSNHGTKSSRLRERKTPMTPASDQCYSYSCNEQFLFDAAGCWLRQQLQQQQQQRSGLAQRRRRRRR